MAFGFSDLLQAIPGILSSFRGINTGAQANLTGQQQNISNAIYNPNNPLYQQLYGQQRQNINQNTAASIAQAGNQNRLLSGMGRTPLFSPERNGEQSFRQAVMGQQNSDVQAQDQTRNILGQGMNAVNGALSGANNYSQLQYGSNRLNQGTGNQNNIGFNSIAQLLRGF